jgi:hypothetical protein
MRFIPLLRGISAEEVALCEKSGDSGESGCSGKRGDAAVG